MTRPSDLSTLERQELGWVADIEVNTKERAALTLALETTSGARARHAVRKMRRRLEKQNAALWGELQATQRRLLWERDVERPLITYAHEVAVRWEGKPMGGGVLPALKELAAVADFCDELCHHNQPIEKARARVRKLLQKPHPATGAQLHATDYYPKAARRAEIAAEVWAQTIAEMIMPGKLVDRCKGIDAWAGMCQCFLDMATIGAAFLEGSPGKMGKALESLAIGRLEAALCFHRAHACDSDYKKDKDKASRHAQATKLDLRTPKAASVARAVRL